MQNVCYIGIDGGGTHSAAVCLDENGVVLARCKGESINYYSVGLEKAIRTTEAMLIELVQATGHTVAACAIGSSALDERLRDASYDAYCQALSALPILKDADCIVKSDAFMTLGALDEAHGAVLIAGTGVMGLALDEAGELHTVAGWGDVLGDLGSGYHIGLMGIQAALRYTDLTDASCLSLHKACLEHYQLNCIAEIIPLVYTPDFEKSAIASFAKTVCDLAEAGDARSLAILKTAVEHLIDYAQAPGSHFTTPFSLGIYGSLLQKSPLIRKPFASALARKVPHARLLIPHLPAEEAAARYIIQRRSS